MGGLDEAFAYQNQQPYTTIDALNVRPMGTAEKRYRGGSRPGLGKAYQGIQMGGVGGSPIRMMEYVTINHDDGFRSWTDYFNNDPLGAVWSAAGWIGTLPRVLPSSMSALVYEEVAGMVLEAFPINTAEAYTLEALITPYNGAHHGKYQIYACLDDSLPDLLTDGIQIELDLSAGDGTYSGTLSVYSAGVLTSYDLTPGDAGHVDWGLLSVGIDGTTLTAYWNNTLLISQTIPEFTGKRVGLGMECTTEGGICLVDMFRMQYYESSLFDRTRTLLIASAGGKLYQEDQYGVMAEVSTNLTLNADVPLDAVQHGQLLYIADWGPYKIDSTTGGVTTGGSSSTLTDPSVLNFTSLSRGTINPYDDVIVVFNGTGTIVNGTYPISSVAAAAITIGSAIGTGMCSYRIERGPKVYNPKTKTLSLWFATIGQVPTGCRHLCMYRERMTLANQENSPHIWYQSRQSDPYDWDFSEDDAGAAVAGLNATAGSPGEPITALAAFNDDFLVFGCTNSLWVLRGDAAYGGMLDNLSSDIGIVSGSAWCRIPSGEMVFLSRDGMYYVQPGAGSPPSPLSRDKLPRRLLDIDIGNPMVSMVYDVRYKGVHLYITDDGKQQRHWWVDWKTMSYWPVRLQVDHEPTRVKRHDSESAEESAVYLGCRDGHIRRYHDSFTMDDGSPIQSRVVLGPIRTAGSHYDRGRIEEMQGIMGNGSKSTVVTWELLLGESNEALKDARPLFTGNFTPGVNFIERPRGTGGSFAIRLSSTLPWVMEGINVLSTPFGQERRL